MPTCKSLLSHSCFNSYHCSFIATCRTNDKREASFGVSVDICIRSRRMCVVDTDKIGILLLHIGKDSISLCRPESRSQKGFKERGEGRWGGQSEAVRVPAPLEEGENMLCMETELELLGLIVNEGFGPSNL